MKTISVIVPLYNEEEVVVALSNRLVRVLTTDFHNFKHKIIFVDDGSNDNTYKLLVMLHKSNKNIKIIQLSRNFGHHIAITAGLDHAKGDYIVMMDGDLQDRPEEIIKLYNKLSQGYDVVYAERLHKQFSFAKRIKSLLFNKFIGFLIQENIVINSTIFRIMTKQVVENVQQFRENNRYLIGLIGWVGFSHASEKVTHEKRYAGKSKYSFSKQLQLAMNAIISFSDYPLRLVGRIGLFLVFVSTIITLFLVARKILYNTAIIGWTSLITTILFIGGIQIVILGILGEYLGRNYLESKKRPLYIIKKVI